MIYTLDQFGLIRDQDAVIVPQDESAEPYQVYFDWLMAGGVLESIIADPPKPLLPEYKLMAKQSIAARADAFVERLTTAAGIPKSELANFDAKAQAALEYKFEGKAIPLYSAIHQEAQITGETLDELCDKIIERVQQREYVNGLISGMRRTVGWAIDAAADHEAVDNAVAAALAQARVTLGGFVI